MVAIGVMKVVLLRSHLMVQCIRVCVLLICYTLSEGTRKVGLRWLFGTSIRIHTYF
jgi:hypothetical protein